MYKTAKNKIKNQLHTRSFIAMGRRFEIGMVSEDADKIDSWTALATIEINRIDKMLSADNEDNQIGEINRNAGVRAVKVEREIYNVVARAVKTSTLTRGAFDITYASLNRSLWNQNECRATLPDAIHAACTVRLINYENILLNHAGCMVFLKRRGMRITLGGVMKGYAAEMVRLLLQMQGIISGYVNAGGTCVTWGTQPNGQPWTPVALNFTFANDHFSTFNISNLAMVLLNNYSKGIDINGKKYSHEIDPSTGLPLSGIKAVTIICGSAEMADAMARSVLVLGIRSGLSIINQIQHIACLIIDDKNKVHVSQNIQLLFQD